MSYDPATPAKPGLSNTAPNVAQTAGRSSSVFSKGRIGSMNEPSPASTYGETVGGDSVPPTPMTGNDPDESMSKLGRQMEGMLLRHHNSGSSPAKLAGMVDELHASQQLGHSSPFVLQDASSSIEDPFTSEGLVGSQTTPGRHGHASDITPTHRAATSKPSTPSASTSRDDHLNLPYNSPFTPREDRLGQPISPENAQAVNPPDACIFVANLPSNKSDGDLQGAIEQAFHRYGDCWVKIRRDRRGMPFAFVQYRTKPEAEVALIRGKNLIIHGRQCRTETARAQRALYVSRKDGKEPTEEEVRGLLEKAGPIEKIFRPSETDMEKHRLPVGIWVRFAFWEDCRDASRNLRNNPVYHLEQEDEPGRVATFSPNKSLGRSGRTTVTPLQFDPTLHDPRALFVGNLPGSVTRPEIDEIFRGYGSIQSVTINTRHNSGNLNSHAIVVFHSAAAAAAALMGEHDHLALSDNTAVRVEYAMLRRPGYFGSPHRFARHPAVPGLLTNPGPYATAQGSFMPPVPVAGPLFGGIPTHLYFPQQPISPNETGFAATASSNSGFPIATFGMQAPPQSFGCQTQAPVLTTSSGFASSATIPASTSPASSQPRSADLSMTDGGVSIIGYPNSQWNGSYGTLKH